MKAKVKFKPRINRHGEEEIEPGHFVYPPISKVKLKPTVIRPKLTRADIQLCYDGLGVWASDYNKAPHEEIERVRHKLLKLGAKKP